MNFKPVKPVLLFQGFTIPQLNAGTENQLDFDISDGRGRVYQIDYVSNNLVRPTPFFTNSYFSIIIGGQEYIRRAPFLRYGFSVSTGLRRERPVDVNIPESQVIRWHGVNPGGAPPTANEPQSFLILKYTTPEHDAFLKQFQWKNGQGLKRRTYNILVPQATAAGTFNISDVLPRANGNVIGFQIFGLGLNEIVNLSINGVNIVENMPMGYFDAENFYYDTLQKILIAPGSTFNFSVRTLVAPANDSNYYITFYFDN